MATAHPVDDVVRQAMRDSGQPMRDFEAEAMARLMAAFAAVYGDRAVPIRQIVADAICGGWSNHDPTLHALYGGLHDVLRGNLISEQSIGRWFSKHAGRVVGGRCFVRSGGGQRRRKVALLPSQTISKET